MQHPEPAPPSAVLLPDVVDEMAHVNAMFANVKLITVCRLKSVDDMPKFVSDLHASPKWMSYVCAHPQRYEKCMITASVFGFGPTLVALARQKGIKRYQQLPVDAARICLIAQRASLFEMAQFLNALCAYFPFFLGDDEDKGALSPTIMKAFLNQNNRQLAFTNAVSMVFWLPRNHVMNHVNPRLWHNSARDKVRFMFFLCSMRLHPIWGQGVSAWLKVRVGSFLWMSDRSLLRTTLS